MSVLSAQLMSRIMRTRSAYAREPLIVALIVVLAAFVWPTPYHYASYRTVPVRISRISGRAEILTPNGWHLMMAAAPRHSPDNPFADLVTGQPAPDRAALKIVAAFTTVLGLLLGFLERRYRPNVRVTSDSPRFPSWLAWLGWSLATAGALGYIALDALKG